VPDGEPGWRCTADVLRRPAVLGDVVDELAAALDAEHPGAAPRVRRTVAAAIVAADWSWALAAVAAGALACDARVPRLTSAAVWLRWEEGRVSGVALSSRAFWCAPVDPASGHASASVTERLDAQLRAEIGDRLAELDAALRHGPVPLLRRGARAVWGGAGDGIATALRLQSGGSDDAGERLDVAERVLAGAPRSWCAAVPVRAPGPAGEAAFSRRRASCCLYYRLPGTSPCLGCPRREVPTVAVSPDPTPTATA
jgi:hypothetical protein